MLWTRSITVIIPISSMIHLSPRWSLPWSGHIFLYTFRPAGACIDRDTFFYTHSAPLGLALVGTHFSIHIPPRWGLPWSVHIFLYTFRPAGVCLGRYTFFYTPFAPLGLALVGTHFSIHLSPRWGLP